MFKINFSREHKLQPFRGQALLVPHPGELEVGLGPSGSEDVLNLLASCSSSHPSAAACSAASVCPWPFSWSRGCPRSFSGAWLRASSVPPSPQG